MPGTRRCSSPSIMYGGSWVVTPMPCPVRWMKYSPYPASVMTARAARSTSWQAAPGPTAAPPACRDARFLGSAHDVVHSALLEVRFADVDRAGGVGAVAVLEAAEVEDD